jgi:hypothetical protein
MGAAAGRQAHDPGRREQPAQLRHLLALTGMELEAVEEGFVQACAVWSAAGPSCGYSPGAP